MENVLSTSATLLLDQRRHQKIIEEGPWLSEEERLEIGSKVVAGAEAIGYRGLATFEFLRNSNGQFYFMEVNPEFKLSIR